MANGFIESGNIKVFPCGGRDSAYDPFARLTTEYNLISIINKLIDKNSFIVTTHSKNLDLTNDNEPYIINIGGYLFSIDNGAAGIISNASQGNAQNENKYIIAEIVVSSHEDNNNNNLQMLSPLPDSNDTELKFTYREVSNTGGYSPIKEGSNIYGKIDGEGNFISYIRKINNNYYECLQNGELTINTVEGESSYENGLLDNNNGFVGIRFYKNDSAVIGENIITLFQYKDNKWVEYEDSKIKFKTNMEGNRSITIDDGEI